MSYRLKYTQTFEKKIEKIKKKDKVLMEEAMKKGFYGQSDMMIDYNNFFTFGKNLD